MGRKREKVHCYYDIETVDWDVPLAVVCVIDDETTYQNINVDARAHKRGVLTRESAVRQGAIMLQQAREWMEANADVLWAHAGGLFDHLLMWKRGGRPFEIILTGSGVMLAKSRASDGREIHWRDTMPRWLCSLEKVGKAVGLPKLDVARGSLETLAPTEVLTYCRRDVDILRRGSELENAWLESHGVKAGWTSGSAAVEMFRALDPLSYAKCARNQVERRYIVGVDAEEHDGAETELDRWWWDDGDEKPKAAFNIPALSFVRGGRTETRFVGHYTKPIHCYDLHSSYPSQYGKAPVWIGCVPDASTDVDAEGWVDMVEWTWPRNGTGLVHPTAPELSAEGFGTGTLRAMMHWEMAWWLRDIGCRPRRIGCGYRGTERVDGFAGAFVNELFRLKDGGGPHSFFAKVTVNSFHGRAGMNPDRKKLVLRNPDETPDNPTDLLDWYHEVDSHLRVDPTQQPILAATILGRGRLTWSLGVFALEREGHRVLYGDTDSIHTDAAPADAHRAFERWKGTNAMAVTLGPGLGQWGHEGSWSEGIYLAPKVYALRGLIGAFSAPLDVKKVAKGMPVKEQTEDGADVMTWNTFLAALEADKGVPLTRSGLGRIRSASPGDKVTLTRHMRVVTTGRRRGPDGWLTYLRPGEEP